MKKRTLIAAAHVVLAHAGPAALTGPAVTSIPSTAKGTQEFYAKWI